MREGELKRLGSNTPPSPGDVLTGRKRPPREEGGRKGGRGELGGSTQDGTTEGGGGKME